MHANTRRARLSAVAAVAAMLLSMLTVALGTSPAQALSPGVSFSSVASSTWQTNGVVWGLAASQGKVVAGGIFTQLNPPNGGVGSPVATNGLAILDAESGAPDSCQLPIAGANPAVRAVTTSEDGKTVYVGGEFSTIGGVAAPRLAAIDVATCKVLNFHPPTISSTVRAIAVKNGTVYIGGDFQSIGGQQRLRFAALDAATGALKPWVADADATGRAIAVSPDGTKVAIGGLFFNVNGAYSHSIAVVDATSGINLKTYGPNFVPDTSVTHAIISGNDGKFYVGNEGTGGGVFDGRFAVSWDTLNQVWRDTCLGATQALYLYKGTLYSASHAHDCHENSFQDGKRNYFTAENADTSDMLGWDPRGNDGIGEGIGPRAITVGTGRTTGKDFLWYGGEFTQINGQPQQGLVRFGPDDLAKPPSVGVVAEATSEGAIQVRWRASVDPDDSELTYMVYRNGGTTPIWTGQGSSLWWKRPQVSFVDTNVTPGTTYKYTVKVTDGTNTSVASTPVQATALTPASSYASTVRADGPVLDLSSATSGTWVEDVGASASDTRRLNGIAAQGPVASTDSPINDGTGSLSFDGAAAYLWNDEYVQAPTTYSVEAWIKTTTTKGGKIIGYGNGRPKTSDGSTLLSSSYDRQLYMDSGGNVDFGVYTSSATVLRSPKPLNDGAWHHLVGTQGANGMAFYVDGKRVGSNGVNTAQSYKGVWHIGGDNLTGWPNKPSSNFFAGLIDEAAVYPTVLGSQKVAAHYKAGGGTFTVTPRPTDNYGGAVYDDDPDLYWRLDEPTGNNVAADSSYDGANPGTYQPGVQHNVTPGAVPNDSAAQANGTVTGTIATQSSLAAPTTFTAEGWFNTPSTNAGGGKIFGFENSPTGIASTSFDRNLYMRNDGRLTYGTNSGSTSTITTPGSYNDGKWHHAVATQGPSGDKLYVDGVLIGSNTAAASGNYTGYWRVGGGGTLSTSWPTRPLNSYFPGKVDEFAVYPTVLSPSDVATHYGFGVNDTQAPTAPTNVNATATGSTVNVTWNAASDNVQVAGYGIYRGVQNNFTPGDSNQVGSTTGAGTSFSETAPAGTYFYKVVAVDGAGNAGPEGTSPAVTVADTQPPSQPGGVTATQQPSSNDVTVAWTASNDNVGVSSYDVYRGTSADFTPDASTKVGSSPGNSYSDSNVAFGSYYYKVIANDAAGNHSSASDPSANVVVADNQPPTAPGNVQAAVNDNDVTVTWSASTDAGGVTGYTVYRSTTAGFVPGTGNAVGDTSGSTLTFLDSNLANGTYYYKVVAHDAGGNSGPAGASNPATVSVTQAQPVTYKVTPTADAYVSSGSPDANYGSNTQLTSRGVTAPLAQTLLKFPIPAAPAGTALTKVVASVRTSGDSAAGTVNPFWFDVSTGSWTEAGITWNNRPQDVGPGQAHVVSFTSAPSTNTVYTSDDGDPSQLQAFLGQTVSLRMADNSSDNVRLFSRYGTAAYWPTLTLTYTPTSGTPSDTEAPSTPTGVTATQQAGGVKVAWTASTDNVGVTSYDVYRGASAGFTPDGTNKVGNSTGTSYTESNVPDGPWFYKVVANDAVPNHSSASAAAAVTVDTQAPSTPGNVTATVNTDDVTLTWSASTDTGGVTGYTVYRATSAGFTPGPGNKVNDTNASTLTLVDSNLPANTYYYKVVAHDGAGNDSTPGSSNPANVTSGNPAQPVTLKVTPTADAYVSSGSPDTNYGTNTQLTSRGVNAPLAQSFLKFPLPSAPAGTTLTKVVASVRTSGDSTAGTVNPFWFDVVSDPWEESGATGVTWNTRPTTVVGSTHLANFASAPNTNTVYTSADGDVSQLQGLLGQTVSLRLADNSTDNVRLFSREYGTAAYWPTLTLTFTPTP